MKKLAISLIAICSVLTAYSDIIVEKTDGSYATPADGVISADATGEYMLGDISVADIKKVYNNPIPQPQQGEMLQPVAEWVKPIAVLDMNQRNGMQENSEDGRYLYSAEYMVQLAGIPYFITQSLDEAMQNGSMIVFAGNILKKSFTDAEYDTLRAWVEAGGIIFSPAVEYGTSERILDLYGCKSITPKLKTHTTIKWDEGSDYPELAYIDTDEEIDTYIGVNQIFTTIYDVEDAEVLATYDDTDDPAVIRHAIGNGWVYAAGIRWRDVIQRNQLNKGGNNRVKNNNFEASADIFPLFLRACRAKTLPVSVWKHTIPDGYATVLIPTHDCDSRTAYDEMHWMSEYEKEVGLKSHFFITTHYFRQAGYLSAFYNDETIPEAQALLADGHTVGSHSICHLPDFSNTQRFPLTATTPDEYATTCTFDIDNKVTTGGSTWAEVVMSKQIIERDLGNHVRSFRSGHLCMNANIPEALAMGDYSFTSCFTATDLWCSFPFFQRLEGKWTGELTNVLQMPLHYSDVRPTGVNMTADEIEGTMPVWLDLHLKLKDNYAPNILLIHPNAKWKMEAEKRFVELLDPDSVGLYNFEDYGDFWVKRLQLDYDFAYSDGRVDIKVKADDLTPFKGQGLIIETLQPLDSVSVADSTGRIHLTRMVRISPTRIVAVI